MNQPTENYERSRFVVLFHEFPADHKRNDHWDLMLQSGEKLDTWALSEMPGPGKSIPAVRIADHRTCYLDFEGQVSGDRGRVTRVRRGEFFWVPGCGQTRAVLEFDEGRWEVEIRNEDQSCLIIVE